MLSSAASPAVGVPRSSPQTQLCPPAKAAHFSARNPAISCSCLKQLPAPHWKPAPSLPLSRTSLPQKQPFQQHQKRSSPVVTRGAADGDASAAQLDPLESAVAKITGPKLAQTTVTVGFILVWYAMNIGFNLLNKSIFKYFPFPWTVSTVHVVIGLIYCVAVYALGFKGASFGRVISKKEFNSLLGPASMHALGHIAANLSFAAVAISLTHTVKTLEPAFNVLLTRVVLGEATPLPALLSLIPIMVGVGMASAGELSFNWTGFLTAMASNLTFGFRAVWSKRVEEEETGRSGLRFTDGPHYLVMTKTLASTSVYAYTTLISVIICVPLALIFEGGALVEGSKAAIAKVGAQRFYGDLIGVGLLYHLYNQFAFNTLQRVSPVSHGVCNVVKRVAIIFSSVFFFGQVLSQQALIGTCIAIFGTYLYTEAARRYGTAKKATPPPKGA